MDQPPRPAQRGRVAGFWASLGPGLVTGAADDDPSGIATYSIAGARFGTAFLWTALATWPLMYAVQMTCARIGMVTGRGLGAALRKRLPRPALILIAGALFLANTLNVGADLAGMSDAAELLSGVPSAIWVVAFGLGIAWATIQLRYGAIVTVLKWLTVVLFAYVAAAFLVGPDWGAVARDTLIPRVPDGRAAWQTLVALLGTTISPYLFFWQASEEVEEEKAAGRRHLSDRVGASLQEIRKRRLDVRVGTLLSNLVTFFIILTTGLTLHRAGITNLSTSREVASALAPLAGRFASWLYTIGLVGTGALAIPTLAGSASYAFADAFDWRQGMDERFRRARAFYGMFALSIALGMAMDFAHVNAVAAMYWSAVVNGLLAPVLLVMILVVASNRGIMNEQPSPFFIRAGVATTALLMIGAAVMMVRA